LNLVITAVLLVSLNHIVLGIHCETIAPVFYLGIQGGSILCMWLVRLILLLFIFLFKLNFIPL
jgi:hypothetical protein